MTKIAVLGGSGKMGTAITRLALEDEALQLVGVLSSRYAGLPVLGSALTYESDIIGVIEDAEVIIDFTLPEGVRDHIKAACEAGKAYVSGTTGLTDLDKQLFQQAGQSIPVLWSSNMSIGITVLRGIIAQAAAQLDASFDVEILEMHHRGKKDAPSGTALMMGESVARGRGRELSSAEKQCRTSSRQKGEIGFATLRGGRVPGDCTVIFAGDDEVIEIKHSALNRDTFAKGALVAAKWIVGKPAGLYTMADVFI